YDTKGRWSVRLCSQRLRRFRRLCGRLERLAWQCCLAVLYVDCFCRVCDRALRILFCNSCDYRGWFPAVTHIPELDRLASRQRNAAGGELFEGGRVALTCRGLLCSWSPP